MVVIGIGVAVFASRPRHVEALARTAPPAAKPSALSIALAPHDGSEPIDAEIVAAQKHAATTENPRALKQLGWLFVQKARLSNDPGFYKLAEQCALAIEARTPDQPDALLLRGHAIEAMHRFRDAEAIARRLVAQREYVLDFALLGDALMEQGRLDEAVVAYQKMADLKPCLQVYTRVAHMRWLKGDLEGAIEVAEEAVSTGTGRDPEPLVWALTKLGTYQFENGDLARANLACDQALARLPHSAGALLLRGRLLLAEDRAAEAIVPLREAAERNPLPEPQWALADALRAAGKSTEAAAVEARIDAHGAAEDPRSFSIYLATRGQRVDDALRLAQRELEQRQDLFTYDALAWANLAAGHSAEARRFSEKAVAEGTHDARLAMHAAIIAARVGAADAPALLQAARTVRANLLPSEQLALDRTTAAPIIQSASQPNP